MKAELCPVCQGSGIYKWYYPSDTVAEHSGVCHACGGKGWVEVNDSQGWPNVYHPPVDCCEACGQRRDEPALTGCPKGTHYGTYAD